MRGLLGVASGFAIGALGLLVLWSTGTLSPPEGLRRRVVSFVALYPAPTAAAGIRRIPCAPMQEVAVYVVCTEDCEGIWRLMAARGLRVTSLANLNRIPGEPIADIRRRINRLVAQQGLRLDPGSARDMALCHMGLEGLLPELVLEEVDRLAVERARSGGEPALQRLAESLDGRDAAGRLSVSEVEAGFVVRALYWDTSSIGRPVVPITYQIRRDGTLDDVLIDDAPSDGAIMEGASSDGS